MFPDTYILESRLRQLECLPWAIPVSVIVRMTEEDFDLLDMAKDPDEYWSTLNRIVARIEKEAA
jgi:hypothetical protein